MSSRQRRSTTVQVFYVSADIAYHKVFFHNYYNLIQFLTTTILAMDTGTPSDSILVTLNYFINFKNVTNIDVALF